MLYDRCLEMLREDVQLDDGERTEKVINAYDAVREAAVIAVEQRNEKLEAREGYLERQLFGAPEHSTYVDNTSKAAAQRSFTEALVKLGDILEPEDLQDYMALAQKTGDSTLAKAAFVVAHERGWGEVMSPYLQGNERAQGLYAELTSIPLTLRPASAPSGPRARRYRSRDSVRYVPRRKLARARAAERARPRLVG